MKLENYSVVKSQKNERILNLQSFIDRLSQEYPTLVDANIDGYTIIGKTAKYQQFLGKKDNNFYKLNLKRNTKSNQSFTQKLEKEILPMNITTKKLKDVKFDDSIFVPLKSNTPIDYCFSQEGGIMPGTNYIVIGDPGIGKSSVTIEFVARIQNENPTKKILFISGEMTELDLIPYTKRFPLWLDIETLFVKDLTESLYKESIETKIAEGYDLILGDSFAEIADAIRGDINEYSSAANKKTYNDVEKWLVDIMVKNNNANNSLNKNTAFIFIQQMTKGGTFVGSNRIKHNTTGMIELRYTKSGERKIVVSKNRRGFEYDDLQFSFTTNHNEPIFYDVDRIIRDKKVQEEIKKAASEQLDLERETDKWFEQLGASFSEDSEA